MCNDLWKLYHGVILSKVFLTDSYLPFLGTSENLIFNLKPCFQSECPPAFLRMLTLMVLVLLWSLPGCASHTKVVQTAVVNSKGEKEKRYSPTATVNTACIENCTGFNCHLCFDPASSLSGSISFSSLSAVCICPSGPLVPPLSFPFLSFLSHLFHLTCVCAWIRSQHSFFCPQERQT